MNLRSEIPRYLWQRRRLAAGTILSCSFSAGLAAAYGDRASDASRYRSVMTITIVVPCLAQTNCGWPGASLGRQRGSGADQARLWPVRRGIG